MYEAELELPAETRKPHLSPFYRAVGYLLPGPIAVAVAFPVAPVLVLPSVSLLVLGWSVAAVEVEEPPAVWIAVEVEEPPAVWIAVAPAAEPVRVVSAVEVVLLVPSYFSQIPASRQAAELKSIPAPHRSALSIHYRAEKKKKKGI
jgi:hypothetical protein